MKLTPDHERITDTVHRWAREKVNPHVEKWEAEESFPAHELFGQLGELGLLGLQKPVENGGMGLDYSYAAVCQRRSKTRPLGGAKVGHLAAHSGNVGRA